MAKNSEIGFSYGDTYVYGNNSLTGSAWTNTAYRNLTITKDTPVSPVFYNWFMANATEVVSISGMWYFNETPTKCPGDFDVNFTSNGSSFIGIYYSGEAAKSDPIRYVASSSSTYLTVYDNKIWTSEAYRVISFTTTQYVPKIFYNWLIANATQYDFPDLNGTYNFNDSLNIIFRSDLNKKHVSIEFTSNKTSYSAMSFTSGAAASCALYYGTISSPVIYQITGWSNSAYQTISIVTPFKYSTDPTFYKWFIENAVKQ